MFGVVCVKLFFNFLFKAQAKAGVTQPLSVPLGTTKPVQPANQMRVRLEDDVVMSDDEEFKEATDVAMTTELHPFPVPPSQQLASSMGVSTHRVQVMKASFFGADGDNTPLEKQSPLALMHPSIFQTTPTPSSLILEHSPLVRSGEQRGPLQSLSTRLQRSSVRGSPSSILSAPPERYPHPTVSSLHAQASVIMAKHNLFQLVPREKSLVNNDTNNIADAALMLGRSFRVGWGTNWTLTHSGKPISHSMDGKSVGLFSSVASGSSLGSSGEGLPLRVVVEQVHIGALEGATLTLLKSVSFHLHVHVPCLWLIVKVCDLATLVLC